VERHLVRGDATVDLFGRLTRFDPRQAAMQPGVMPDRMTLGHNSPHQVRMFGCGLADQKEGHADAFENRSDPFGSHSIRREFASSLF
jgi:hypothetical protein